MDEQESRAGVSCESGPTRGLTTPRFPCTQCGNPRVEYVSNEPSDDSSRPWGWYAPTIGSHPNASNEWVLKQLVEKGFTVAGVNVGESYDSPAGRKIFSDFYDHLVKDR